MKKITIELEDNSLYDNVLTIVLTGGAGTGMICTTHGCYDLSKGTRFVLSEKKGALSQCEEVQ